MLSVDDVEKDYEAVMESWVRLFAVDGRWPREGFTLEENLADLQRHQHEFIKRIGFAYTVISLDESRVLGCVYINRVKHRSVDASVTMWVRESEYEKGLDPTLFKAVSEWLDSAWPFKKVVYPYR